MDCRVKPGNDGDEHEAGLASRDNLSRTIV
jgi:hypothetical protein